MKGKNRCNIFSKPSNPIINSLDSSPYLQSLKLKETPDLMKKLRAINDRVKEERVTDVRNFGYNRNILVGNWFEERKHKQVVHANTYCTTYNAEYLLPSCYRTEEVQKTDMKFPAKKCDEKSENDKDSGEEDKLCPVCENSGTKGRCMYYTEYTRSYVPYRMTKTDDEILDEVKRLTQCAKGNCFVRQTTGVKTFSPLHRLIIFN